MARAAQTRRAVGGQVQIIFKTDLSAEKYVSTTAWVDAKLEVCPKHPDGGCGYHRNGTYRRQAPRGIKGDFKVARYYCRKSQTTFSLLPQFMAAQTPGTLDEIENVAAARASDASFDAVEQQVRPEYTIDRSASQHWMKRRCEWVEGFLKTFCTLLPDFFPDLTGTDQFQIRKVRQVMGTDSVLVALRLHGSAHLQLLNAPVGLRCRSRPVESKSDPPTLDDHSPPHGKSCRSRCTGQIAH